MDPDTYFRALGRDQEDVKNLLKTLKILLVPRKEEEPMFVAIHGPGNSGKTTLIHLLQKMVKSETWGEPWPLARIEPVGSYSWNHPDKDVLLVHISGNREVLDLRGVVSQNWRYILSADDFRKIIRSGHPFTDIYLPNVFNPSPTFHRDMKNINLEDFRAYLEKCEV